MIFLELNLGDREIITSFGFDESDKIVSLLKQKAPHIVWKVTITESEVGNEVYGYCILEVPTAQQDEAKELFDLIMDGEDISEYEFNGSKSEPYYEIMEKLDDDIILKKSVEDFIIALKQASRELYELSGDNLIKSYSRLYHILLKLNSLSRCLPSGHPYIHIDYSIIENKIQPSYLEPNFNKIAEKVDYIVSECIHYTEHAKYENYPEIWSSIVSEWNQIFGSNIVEQLMNEIRYAMFSEYIKKGYQFAKIFF
jgi:hypothetical protein